VLFEVIKYSENKWNEAMNVSSSSSSSSSSSLFSEDVWFSCERFEFASM
jgi:hypothetical protein